MRTETGKVFYKDEANAFVFQEATLLLNEFVVIC